MDHESIRVLSDYVALLAKQQEAIATTQPTRENWNAKQCLVDAERHLFSAAAWLARAEGE
ncbi:MAG TPA: hypothetical protein VFX15_03675 [Actinomycetes bacterium]|nr:hypothetical protein [Actinomycetes bacterium]